MFFYYLPFLRSWQASILIFSSFFFYAFDKPLLLLLLTVSIFIIALYSHFVYHGYKGRRYLWTFIGIFISLFLLGFFKYSPLLAKTFLFLTGGTNYFAKLFLMIPLPIGISFFTFEGVSLLADSYRYQTGSERKQELRLDAGFWPHLKKTALFISFFPHLIAGPIVKAHQFYPQIEAKYFKDIDWEYAFKTLVAGYFLKMVIADNLKDQTFWIVYPYFNTQSTFTLIALLFGYSMQIFSDFAGYSLIALGAAALFGYRLPVNFNFPYIARSFAEFWQRWHISLSTWLKEYLYIPLGGNRKGGLRTYFNLMAVMFLGGLWHGAAWSYAVWGTWHGALLAIERFFKNRLNLPEGGFLLNLVKALTVFTLVSVSWIFFKLTNFFHVLLYFQKMLANTALKNNMLVIKTVFIYSVPVIAYHAFYLLKERDLFNKTAGRLEFMIYGIMLFFILLNSGTANEFIYFQF